MLQRQIGQLAGRSSRVASSMSRTGVSLVLTRSVANSSQKSSFSRKGASAASSKKKTTPKKTKGSSIYSFAHTAAYSNYQKNAPELSEELPGTHLLDGTKPLQAAVEVAEGEGEGKEIESAAALAATAPAEAQVLRYSSDTAKALTYFGSFKLTQRNELFKDRATLVRPSSTGALFEIIKKGTSSSSKTNRFCITGAKGVGKSTALAQAQALALENGYVVIPVPQAHELVSGEFDAVINKKKQKESGSSAASTIFQQPMYVKRWMERIAKGNKELLSTIKISQDYSFETPGSQKKLKFTKGEHTIYSLLTNRSHSERCDIVEIVITELANQSDVPVLFTLDEFNVFAAKNYARNRDVDNKPIYHGQLQVPNTFLQFFSGEREFKNGAVIAALAAYKNGETIPVGLGLKAQAEPYSRANEYDHVLASKLLANGGVKPLDVSPFTLEETKTILSYYSNGGVISEPVSDSLVQQKYFLSGNGNPQALLKSCVEVFY